MSDSLLFTFNGPKSKFKLKISSNEFWFEFFDIHMNEIPITSHDYHGFKWQNINIYSILTKEICGPNTLFGSSDCDYTHLKEPMIYLFMMMMKFLLYELWIRGV
jgi:hypothetical protein